MRVIGHSTLIFSLSTFILFSRCSKMPVLENIEDLTKKLEYINMLSQLQPTRVKFVSERKLECPSSRNKFYVTLFCGIDRRSTPLQFGIGQGTINATMFSEAVEFALASRWLLPGDILVMNNSKIHTGGENTVLEDWLWDSFRILVLFLPPRTPKWTPANAVWKDVTQMMRSTLLNPFQENSVVHVAQNVLNTFTHREMECFYSDCYAKCGL